MTVIDKLNDINGVIKELFEFVQTDDTTKDDFNEYLSTMGGGNISAQQMEKLFIPYVFERNLGKPAKSVIEIFCESKSGKKNPIAKSFLSAQYSIFRIIKILKNGFELFNLTNEKTYKVLSLTKMTNFRGVGVGEYIVARIFENNDEYYLMGIDNMLSSSQTKEAIRYAIVKILQSPWLVYEDNKDKENEIKSDIKVMYKKFKEIFNSDEIVTTNRFADSIIGVLNDEDDINSLNMEEVVKPLDEYRYFVVKELNNNYDNFLENSLGGFSSHKEIYDVGIICDEELGLYSVPFYKTFCEIFEGKNKINDEKGCINYFLKNDSISDKIIKRVASLYPNFIMKINEVLESDYTLETLIEEYKPEFLKRKIYSSTSVLYHSTVFSTSIEMVETNFKKQEQSNQEVVQSAKKVGRNEPCPCGSGKKYKNCCLK